MTTWTKSGGKWSKKSLFLSRFRVKNVHIEVGGGQKRAKLCPRSHCMPPCGLYSNFKQFLLNKVTDSIKARILLAEPLNSANLFIDL